MIELRVVTKHHPGDREPFVHDCPTERFAVEWAAIEREEYPRAEVWIERRWVDPWERVSDEEVRTDEK